jgi:hypothetical protein
VNDGLPCCSAHDVTPVMTTKIKVIAARIATPCRMSPTMRPNTKQSAAGMSSMAIICVKFVSGVGFS